MRRVLAILAVACMAAAAEAATVRLAGAAAVDHNLVTLSDVATIDGTPEERERLAGVPVGYLSEGAGSVTIDADKVKGALADAGVNLGNVNFSGATAARVTRDAATVSRPASVAGAVETYLKGLDPEGRYKVSAVRFDWGRNAPSAPVIVAATPAAAVGAVTFDCADARDLSRIVGHICADVAKMQPVVIARRRISSGRIIAPEDVETAYLDDPSAKGFFSDVSDVLGKRLLFTVEAGRPVSEKYIHNEDAVKRGDEVILTVMGGAMTVTVRTVSMQNAGVGDAVRLRRVGGKNEYVGRITGPGRAVPATGGQQ